MMHGDADVNIPVRHARAILAANPSIRYWEVAGAGHEGVWRSSPAQYEERLLAFVQSVVPR
jgi:hypothetical protein